jgi:hypothetical protein
MNWLEKKLKQLELFLKVPALTEELDWCCNCLTLSAAVFLGYFKYALPVVVGAF